MDLARERSVPITRQETHRDAADRESPLTRDQDETKDVADAAIS